MTTTTDQTDHNGYPVTGTVTDMHGRIISVGVGTIQPDDAPMVWVTPERPGRGGQPQPLVNICFDTVNQVDALMAALKEARRKFVADARGKVRHG
jgi:hypothetical protein